MRYFLKRADINSVWDEVNVTVFNDRKFALIENPVTNELDYPRYTGDYVIINTSGFMEIKGDNLSKTDMSIIMRFCAVKEAMYPAIVGGTVKTPEFIRFKKRNSSYIHELATGTNYRSINTHTSVPKQTDVA